MIEKKSPAGLDKKGMPNIRHTSPNFMIRPGLK